MGGATKIASFTQLDAWKSAHVLRLSVYAMIGGFPPEERYALADQLRRAAISVGSNIAEGFSRRTAGDKAHFYTMAQGSLTEVQDQLVLARDLQYITELQFRDLADKSVVAHKLITGLIKAVRAREK
ncbi:MAG TPA: four helix bundle protein [Candidatus Saccharimonadales bacterium]|nr:four helix bundle protein [Candidatus Saccharimonadales bacterium]